MTDDAHCRSARLFMGFRGSGRSPEFPNSEERKSCSLWRVWRSMLSRMPSRFCEALALTLALALAHISRAFNPCRSDVRAYEQVVRAEQSSNDEAACVPTYIFCLMDLMPRGALNTRRNLVKQRLSKRSQWPYEGCRLRSEGWPYEMHDQSG